MISDLEEKRLNFGHLVDRVFWGLMTSVAIYAASQIRDMSNSIASLNEKMAVVIVQLSDTERRLDAQSRRIEKLEDRAFRH